MLPPVIRKGGIPRTGVESAAPLWGAGALLLLGAAGLTALQVYRDGRKARREKSN